MTKFSLGALVAAGLLAGGLTASSASAADLGGNCCADLEERIAELEATTARKGNRKVSLTISGWVAEQVMWWDDGFESNVYVEGIGSTLSSHVKFTGQATISPGWSAGYVMHLELDGDTARQDNQAGIGSLGANVLQSFWFIKSDTLGKVSVGLQSQASDNTAILVDGSGSLVPANWVTFTGDTFFLRNSIGGPVGTGVFGPGSVPPAGPPGVPGTQIAATWNDVAFCNTLGAGVGGDCNGVPLNAIRYDSPTFGGFSVSASWGEDDFWDVAGRYAGEFGGFKVAVAAAYSEMTDESTLAFVGSGKKDVQYFQIGGYVEHVATGLWVYGAWGREQTDNLSPTLDINNNGINDHFPTAIPDGDVWYVKAGLRERWTPLGHTVLYGYYGRNEDKMNPAFISDHATSSEMNAWGFGAVQEIDAAAMSLWINYQRNEGDIDCNNFNDSVCSRGGGTNTHLDFEDLDTVKAGALINF